MAAYNPCNFDLGQFMNDLFQQPDLANQLQFLGSHLQVINSYVLRWVCVENSLKRALKSSTRTPGSEDKKTLRRSAARRRDWAEL
jgi:hypothetical protein